MTERRPWPAFYEFFAISSVTTLVSVSYLLFGLFLPTTDTPPKVLSLGLLAVFLSLNLATLFYAGFVHSISGQKTSIFADERSMLGFIGIAEALLIIMDMTDTVAPIESFVTLSILQTYGIYLFFKHACSFLKSADNRLRNVPLIAAGAMAAFALGAFPLRNWFLASHLIHNSILWQACVISIGFISVMVIDQLPIKFQWSLSGITGLVSAAAGQQSSQLRRRLYVGSHFSPAILGASFWIMGELSIQSDSSGPALWVLGGCSSLFIPAIMLAWAKLLEQNQLNGELLVSSRLAGPSALRLLKRNLRDDHAWAASIGVRTSVFTIDHDPDASLIALLPASIMQIRNEEIQRCINDVLQQKMLHQHTSGQKIFGALDAEHSVRPCIDVVKLFACLYLDAGPLIERRINGLSTLLPIINPGLSQILKTDTISEILKKNQWFFHLEYHWVDQHLINTANATRYGVHIDPIPHEQRQAMVSQLQRANGMGSFIWMGRNAHERLLQEAPMLDQVIEPLSINRSDGSEDLVFILKFENLIPRLQRYFDLDYTRKVLMDYEVGSEALKLINIFKVQSTQATSPEAMLNLVESIASYPWRGFKEKDQALRIVVTAHQFSKNFIENCENKGQPVPRMLLKLCEAIQVGVEKIGYPAQILHMAQMKKIAQRDLHQLLKSVVSVAESRFEESWTLLGSLDLKRRTRAERMLVAAFLTNDNTLSGVLERSDIQCKVVDTLVNLVKAEHSLKDETIEPEHALSALSSILAKKTVSAETLTLLFDGTIFLGQLFGRDMTHVLLAIPSLELAVKRTESGPSPYSHSLWSRWQEMKQKSAVAATLSSRKPAA